MYIWTSGLRLFNFITKDTTYEPISKVRTAGWNTAATRNRPYMQCQGRPCFLEGNCDVTIQPKHDQAWKSHSSQMNIKSPLRWTVCPATAAIASCRKIGALGGLHRPARATTWHCEGAPQVNRAARHEHPLRPGVRLRSSGAGGEEKPNNSGLNLGRHPRTASDSTQLLEPIWSEGR